MLILFSATIFTGALLLFLMQPLVGRMVLPLLGGSPAVWTTTMLFFQTVLLAAYGYAHFSLRRLDIRRQVSIHLVLLLVPVLSLPVAIGSGVTGPSVSSPIAGLLLLLAATVGLPFFVVSTTSPLLQRWFAAAGHKSSMDPYFLYAAGNCGSLLALVIYPVLIEPNWRLPVQSWWWAVSYGVFAGMVALCGFWVRRMVRAEPPVTAKEALPRPEPVTVGRRIRWVALATVPCSLMLSVTTYLTSELAPVPLLWVIPLGIYLLTFVLVFARRQLIPHRLMVHVLPVIVATVLFTLVTGLIKPLGPLLGLHLVCLFVVAMACHGELAKDRPPVDHLTGYYLWMSVGGALGGVLNALLAPVLFKTVLEYPLTLVLACALVLVTVRQKTGLKAWLPALLPAVPLGLLALLFLRYMPMAASGSRVANSFLVFGALCGICLLFMRDSRRFSLTLLMVVVVGLVVPERNIRVLKKERSFFGVHRVETDSPGKFRLLLHGNTVHGVQSLDPARRREPLGYYSRSGPLGQVIAATAPSLKQRVGVIGLGTGTLASYGQAGEQWTFFEIDPVVEKLARNVQYFSFLADSPAKVDVTLGDARLALARVDDGRFGLLVVDAFTADLVPLHLMTREALALYRSKLSSGGVLIFNISNQHLWLERVVAMLARDAGWSCLVRSDPLDSAETRASGKFSSKWIVLAQTRATLSELAADPRWQAPPAQLNSPVWTDDYTSIFSIFKW